MLNVHHMHTLVCRMFKWNYEQQTLTGLRERMHLQTFVNNPLYMDRGPTKAERAYKIGSQTLTVIRKVYQNFCTHGTSVSYCCPTSVQLFTDCKV